VLASLVEGQAAAFDDRYERPHLDEVLATAGVRTAQRFSVEAAAVRHRPMGSWRGRRPRETARRR
jgi:hypothetical protein